ncbi:MAG TPA: protein kinase, partial [Kofleriaceae bacterium]|nr:protein kinase [Kofleriaceae bacterium]
MRLGELVEDRFVLEALAGTGGMGTVYRALDRTTGANVALKVLKSSSQDAVERFVRETRVLEALRHPAI